MKKGDKWLDEYHYSSYNSLSMLEPSYSRHITHTSDEIESLSETYNSPVYYYSPLLEEKLP